MGVEEVHVRPFLSVAEELLDFILAYDTEELQDILSSSAFIPMSIALSHPGLKLKAYRAWQAARALHNDEKCVLLGETMLKDTTHQNPEVRLACVETYFLLMPNEAPGCGRDCLVLGLLESLQFKCCLMRSCALEQ